MPQVKRGWPRRLDKQIGHQTGMTAIAIGEGMDQHQAMVEADGDSSGE